MNKIEARIARLEENSELKSTKKRLGGIFTHPDCNLFGLDEEEIFDNYEPPGTLLILPCRHRDGLDGVTCWKICTRRKKCDYAIGRQKADEASQKARKELNVRVKKANSTSK
jgi:hypothetical protein